MPGDPIGSKYSAEALSRCPTLIVLKETAQSLLASQRSPTMLLRGSPRQRKQQAIVFSLVVTFPVVVLDVLRVLREKIVNC